MKSLRSSLLAGRRCSGVIASGWLPTATPRRCSTWPATPATSRMRWNASGRSTGDSMGTVPTPPASRNAPCPCGSGRRYKECHGAPGDATGWVERALRELQARDFSAAEASLREAERLAPDDPRIHANLGTVYVRQRRLADAEAPFARALALDPHNPYVLTLLAHARQRRCAWTGLSELHARITRLLAANGDHAHADFNPFALLAMPITSRQQLAAARRFARGLAPASPARRAEVQFA